MMNEPEKKNEARCPAQPRAQCGARAALAHGAITLLTVLFTACGSGEGEDEGRPDPFDDATIRKVLVIGIDGVRADVMAEVPTPNLDVLAESGWFNDGTTTTTPSVSGPAWSSMLTGVWPDKHGVLDNDFADRRYEEYPDFLTRIERERPQLITFAVVDWLPLIEQDEGPAAIGSLVEVREALDGYELGWAEADARSVELARRYLEARDPAALFVYLGEPDETSHQHGSIGVEYRESIARVDAHVGRLVETIEARPDHHLEEWLILVTTDHGRRADGSHGGASEEEMTAFILAGGSGVQAAAPSGPIAIVDVAVTALDHMRIPIDPAWGLDGRVLEVR